MTFDTFLCFEYRILYVKYFRRNDLHLLRTLIHFVTFAFPSLRFMVRKKKEEEEEDERKVCAPAFQKKNSQLTLYSKMSLLSLLYSLLQLSLSSTTLSLLYSLLSFSLFLSLSFSFFLSLFLSTHTHTRCSPSMVLSMSLKHFSCHN